MNAKIVIDDPEPIDDLIIDVDFAPVVCLHKPTQEEDRQMLRRRLEQLQKLTNRLGCRLRCKIDDQTWMSVPGRALDSLWKSYEELQRAQPG